ncbi:MAG: hypothetical protein ACK4RS_01925, partial [Thiothrix sp.]
MEIKFSKKFPTAPAKREAEGNVVWRGVKRGLSDTVDLAQLAYGAATGDEGFVEDQLLDMERTQRRTVRDDDTRRFTDISGIGEAANWAGGTLGEFGADIAALLTGAGAGAVLGKAAVKGAAKAGIGAGLGGVKTGAITGGLAASYPAQMGEVSAGMYREKGVLEEGDAQVAAGAAVVMSALEVAPFMRLLGGKLGGEVATNGILSRIGTGALKQAGAEGITEGLQETIKIAALDYVNEHRDSFGVDDIRDIIDATAAGALGGGVIGGLGSGLSGSRRREDFGADEEEPKIKGGEPGTELVRGGIEGEYIPRGEFSAEDDGLTDGGAGGYTNDSANSNHKKSSHIALNPNNPDRSSPTGQDIFSAEIPEIPLEHYEAAYKLLPAPAQEMVSAAVSSADDKVFEDFASKYRPNEYERGLLSRLVKGLRSKRAQVKPVTADKPDVRRSEVALLKPAGYEKLPRETREMIDAAVLSGSEQGAIEVLNRFIEDKRPARWEVAALSQMIKAGLDSRREQVKKSDKTTVLRSPDIPPIPLQPAPPPAPEPNKKIDVQPPADIASDVFKSSPVPAPEANKPEFPNIEFYAVGDGGMKRDERSEEGVKTQAFGAGLMKANQEKADGQREDTVVRDGDRQEEP